MIDREGDTWYSRGILDAEHQCEQRPVIETCKTYIKHNFPYKDARPGHRKSKVKHHDRRKEEREESEHDCAQEELIEIVVAGVNTVAKDVSLFAAEEME